MNTGASWPGPTIGPRHRRRRPRWSRNDCCARTAGAEPPTTSVGSTIACTKMFASGTCPGGRSARAPTRRCSGGRSTGSTRGRATTPGRLSSGLARSGWWGLHASTGTEVLMHARWQRHAVPLPAVVVGGWYGVQHGSSGAFLLAGAGALAWLVWPEASRFLAWRGRRRAEVARARVEPAVTRAWRESARAERAKERADRSPSSATRSRRAKRMERRELRPVAGTGWAMDRALAPDMGRSA